MQSPIFILWTYSERNIHLFFRSYYYADVTVVDSARAASTLKTNQENPILSYWHFFTITDDHNCSRIELLDNESLTVVWISDLSLVPRILQLEQSRAEQKLTAGNQPARSLLASGLGGTRGHIFVGCRDHYGFFSCGTPSLTRGRVWLLYMLLALASAIFLWSELDIWVSDWTNFMRIEYRTPIRTVVCSLLFSVATKSVTISGQRVDL
jgi:hypothetical protein